MIEIISVEECCKTMLSEQTDNEALENFIGTKAAAEITGLSQSRIQRLCREGILKAQHTKEGSPWIIDRNFLIAWNQQRLSKHKGKRA